MTVFITGAAGFIGSSLVDSLLKDGHTVIGFDNFNDYYNPVIKHLNIKDAKQHPNFSIIEGDICDKEALEKVFQNNSIDSIIHLAARAGVRPSLEQCELYTNVNVLGTLNILECAKKFNIKKTLSASSSSVYGNNEKVPFSETDSVDHPISPYAATKKAGELLCYNYHHLYGLDIACLRFFTVYGPRQRPEMAIHKFTHMIDTEQPIPVFNNGECLRDYTYIEDIVNGIKSILNHDAIGYDIVNLGNSATTSTLELITLIETALGKKAKLNLLPAQPGDVDKTFADTQHAKEKYQYSSNYPVKKGIEHFIKWYKENKDVLVNAY
jgi:UDP-glucuronate 4-epimerase